LESRGRSRVDVLGVGFDAVTLAGAVKEIAAWVEGAGAGQPGRRPGIVVTVNPEIVHVSRWDGDLRAVLHGADLVLADGVGVVWAARVLGRPVPERVAGADLVEALLAEGSRRGWRFFLLGGKPGVAEAAGANVKQRAPGVVIAGTEHGYFGPADEDRLIRSINDAHADILLVGLGAPKQEKWIWRNRERISAGVCIGVGGTLDVLAGVVRRAPPALQRAGLEWLYRLVTQPSRYRRMMRLPAFMLEVLIARLRRGGRERD
jgi:N-acetylglucosaminyldiphosphoundecaprenol N-acetyl-beta-D-mannosaminyltransferase